MPPPAPTDTRLGNYARALSTQINRAPGAVGRRLRKPCFFGCVRDILADEQRVLARIGQQELICMLTPSLMHVVGMLAGRLHAFLPASKSLIETGTIKQPSLARVRTVSRHPCRPWCAAAGCARRSR